MLERWFLPAFYFDPPLCAIIEASSAPSGTPFIEQFAPFNAGMCTSGWGLYLRQNWQAQVHISVQVWFAQHCTGIVL